MTLLSASGASAAPAATDLPPDLLAKARSAGSGVDTVETVDGAGRGLFDAAGGHVLHVGRVALASATDPREKAALLAFALSYKIGRAPASATPARRAGDFLAGMLAADVDESVAGRERADPYLALPTAPRRWERQRATPVGGSADPIALRGLAWAKSSGVCERTSVAFLTRLVADAPADASVKNDAKIVLTGLGVLRFAPDEHCRD